MFVMQKVNRTQLAPFLILVLVAVGSIFIPSIVDFADTSKYNFADIAWVLVATALSVFDDTRPRIFLWRYGAPQECYLHNDQKCVGGWYRQLFCGLSLVTAFALAPH
jgi:hypothetical protein